MGEVLDTRVIGGRYRLIETLGAGGMGTVWRAYDDLLGRPVAVKEVRLPPDVDDDDREILVARTVREARTAAQLDEAQIVHVFDVVEDDGRPWVVMELVEGATLSQLVRADGPLPSAAVARVGLAVLRALTAAHAAGILHRDVKPSNVVMATDGRVVLTDFGVATAIGDPTLTATGMLIGSPSYLSPERGRGESGGPESDLWSLGATLYTAVEGRPPFARDGALSTVTAAITEPHDPPIHASAELRQAIDGLLAKDPDDRPAPQEVEALLRAAAPGLPNDPRPVLLRGDEDFFDLFTPLGEQAQPVPLPAKRTPSVTRVVAVLAIAAALLVGAALAFTQLPERLPGQGDPAALDLGRGATPPPTTAAAGAGSPTSPVVGAPEPVEPTAGAPPLPAGFRLHTDETGFSVAVPADWTVVREGSLVDFRDPAGGRFLRIDQTDSPKPDPLADWQAQEPGVAQRLSNYERIRLDAAQWRGWPAADWEFTHGEPGTFQVLNRNLVTGPKAYAIYWSTSQDQWDESLPLLDVVFDTFRPAAG